MLRPEVILFPDATQAITDHLRSALALRTEDYATGTFIGTTVPTPRRTRMVTVRRDGGGPIEASDDARVTLNVWAGTEEDVNDLSRLVGALMGSAANGTPVVSVRHESGPSPVIEESKQPRRLLVFTVRTKGDHL